MEEVDFIIVGQGLAGSILAYRLLTIGKTVKIIDQESGNTASRQATGLINPITGRRFVKSWLIDELYPEAKKTYEEIENKFGSKFLSETSCFKVLQSVEQLNDCQVRLLDDKYQHYLNEEVQEYKSSIHQEFGSIKIQPILQVDINKLQDVLLKEFEHQQAYIKATFDFEKLNIKSNQYRYQNITANHIVFCEGYKVKDNPYFNYLPNRIAKGEALVIKSPSLQLDSVWSNKVTINPMGNHQYYIGATYDWNDYEQKITKAKRDYLIAGIEKTTDCSFEILDQKVGIRPTVLDRRPLIGEHPSYPNMYIFNGLGTKGLSLSPYFSQQLIDFIESGKSIHPEASIKRFK